jgi:hypothetical protein
LRCIEPEIGLESNALAAKDIDYGQESDLCAISEHIVHEVHGPALVDRRRLRRRFADDGSATSPRRFRANCKPFFAIKPSHTFDIDMPSLAPKKDMNSSLAVSNAHFSDRFDARSQRNIEVRTH